ncbi:MAG: hypothetical protein Pg6C_00600 [Treponemataceae bacterium]|jgi:hypothetical protein|nr:MAG: hypothetical protein Pg6C_00600 [Treponemataceae bacterium]
MSKHTEIQNQYKGYVAALEAVKKTNPHNVGVVYRERTVDRNEGIFVYDPEKDIVRIMPCGKNGEDVSIESADIPALIKALREFFE